MKIAIHQPRVSYYVGGGEVVPLEHTARLSDRHEVVLVTSSQPHSDVFEKFIATNPSVEVRYFDVPDNIYETEAGQNQLRWDLESIAFGKATFEQYLDEEFDIIATHYSSDALLIPKETVLHLHGFPHNYRDLDAASVKSADALISVAQFVKEGWKELHGLEDIRLSYNGIDHKRFIPLNTGKEFDVGYIGRLIAVKGVEELIRASAKVKYEKPDLSVVIAGRGPDEERLKDICTELGLSDTIHFVGYVPDDGLLQFYNAAKICVFPSTAREGVLTTMLEASSCGTPVITSDCCGMPEFIEEGYNGRLVPPKRPDKLAEVMLELLTDEEGRIAIGKRARKSILSEWTWDKRIRELEAIYEDIRGGFA